MSRKCSKPRIISPEYFTHFGHNFSWRMERKQSKQRVEKPKIGVSLGTTQPTKITESICLASSADMSLIKERLEKVEQDTSKESFASTNECLFDKSSKPLEQTEFISKSCEEPSSKPLTTVEKTVRETLSDLSLREEIAQLEEDIAVTYPQQLKRFKVARARLVYLKQILRLSSNTIEAYNERSTSSKASVLGKRKSTGITAPPDVENPTQPLKNVEENSPMISTSNLEETASGGMATPASPM